jgi:hypothetical protein
VAEALVVALHLGPRRPLLADFLDQLGVAHEEGLIAEDLEVAPPTDEAVRAAGAALKERHDAAAIRTYWNALWLQDPTRWRALEAAADIL